MGRYVMGGGTHYHHEAHPLSTHIPYTHFILCGFIYPIFLGAYLLGIPSNRLEGEIILLIFIYIFTGYVIIPPRWWLHLMVVRRFEYATDPESYTSGSVAIGRASLAGQVKG